MGPTQSSSIPQQIPCVYPNSCCVGYLARRQSKQGRVLRQSRWENEPRIPERGGTPLSFLTNGQQLERGGSHRCD